MPLTHKNRSAPGVRSSGLFELYFLHGTFAEGSLHCSFTSPAW
jgi:hypothetical protein